ncbi:MAG: response regulator [Betaproteobacteria bacterium]|nr:response regulator [Betaproteobacteria bacterium]
MSAPVLAELSALVIEDNKHMRALLHALLPTLGIRQIIECTDGAAGYTALREKRPDFVLTDLVMEPMDGIGFARQVRTASDSPNPYIPIILMTGHTERVWVEAARDAGVTEFLVKPITLQNLQSRIMEVIERPRPFVRCATYFGPDRRRRRKDPDYAGPRRRKSDIAIV